MKLLRILRMAHLRIALGVVVGAYGLYCLFPIFTNAAFKLGALHPTGDVARMAPLWAETSWLQLAAWLAIVTLFALVAWKLVRGRTALGLYITAVLLDAALWWVMQSSDAYQVAFTSAELQMDYNLLLAKLAVGALIWWAEKRPRAEPSAA